MPISSFALPFLQLSYRPDLGLLFMRWTRAASSAEHRQGYEQALELARQHEAGHWLVDLRIRGLASAEDFAWVLHHFLGQLTAALPHASRRVAYLVTPNHYPTIQARLEQLQLPAAPVAGPATTAFQVFMEEHTAIEWLQQTV